MIWFMLPQITQQKLVPVELIQASKDFESSNCKTFTLNQNVAKSLQSQLKNPTKNLETNTATDLRGKKMQSTYIPKTSQRLSPNPKYWG